MRKTILWTVAVCGSLAGASTLASASPATNLLGRDLTVRSGQVEQVYYYYNHHRYRHRSWDKRHKRWRYY